MRRVLYILGQLGDEDIEWLIGAGTLRRLDPGATLIHEGQPIEALYILLDGALSITTAALDGELARLSSGELIGEISFVDERPPTATVTASEPTRLLALDRTLLREKLEQDPRFAARFYKAVSLFLADRLRATVGRLGYGRLPEPASAATEAGEGLTELNSDVLDNVHLAGARFERILRHFVGG